MLNFSLIRSRNVHHSFIKMNMHIYIFTICLVLQCTHFVFLLFNVKQYKTSSNVHTLFLLSLSVCYFYYALCFSVHIFVLSFSVQDQLPTWHPVHHWSLHQLCHVHPPALQPTKISLDQ